MHDQQGSGSEGTTPQRTRRRRVVLSADLTGQNTYVSALERLPEVHSVTGVPIQDLPSAVDEVKPELVVLLLDERTDSLRVLSQLLTPAVRQRHVMVLLRNCRSDLVRVLRRLGAEAYMITVLSAEILQDKVRSRLTVNSAATSASHPVKRPQRASAGTLNLVAKEISSATRPLSAAEVSARCGLSTVTCRYYLNQLVSRGNAAVSVQHRPVGRPVSLYRWVG
ncbi:hypothetical protein ACLQ2D_11550 [Streptomyces sp. DT199]|uniref:hypothetical protein n=1 Tax=Streptomyces TaxID=1883 RepID=UPI0033A52BB4